MSDAGKDSMKDIRTRLRQAIDHFDRVLPGQAAIKDFVHHNTLHGFEHLPFPQALEAACKITGSYGYLPADQFRELYKQGRIELSDLKQVLQEDEEIKAGEIIFKMGDRDVCHEDIYLATLLHPLEPVTGSQLNWQIEELDAFHSLQADVSEQARERMLASASESGVDNEATAVEALWNACLHVLGLDHFILHPEDLLDLTPEHAEQMLSDLVPDDDHPEGQPMMDRLILKEAGQQLETLFDRVGVDLTVEGMLRALTGHDIEIIKWVNK